MPFLGLHGTFLSDINIDITAVPPPSGSTRGGNTLTLNPALSQEQSATRGRTVQRPGWDRLHWEFTVSERAVRQTWATHLRSFDGVSVAHNPLTLERGHERGTSRRPERNSGWLGAAACLNRFRGFSESILNWEKKLMNQCFYPPLRQSLR